MMSADTGVAIELAVLLGIAVVGQGVFAPFEIETSAWRKILKWTIVIVATLGLYALVGHWSLILPVGAAIAGATFHFIWCRRHGIHPFRATPRRRYYELRGWDYPD